jgi:hypothetical protein
VNSRGGFLTLYASIIRDLRERKQRDPFRIALDRNTRERTNISRRSLNELRPYKSRVAGLGQWRRLKETTVQRIERIMSGKVVLPAPAEEFVVCSSKERLT